MASVLLCALSATGGARYFVSIADTLVRRGHSVTVLSAPDAEQHFADLPVRFGAVMEPAVTTRGVATAPRTQRTRRAFEHIRRRYVAPMPEQWAAVQHAVRRDRIDVVLTENLFLGAMALAYLPRHRRPYVIGLGTIPPVVPDPAVPPYGLGVLPQDHAPGRLVTAVREFVASRAYSGAGLAFQNQVERFTGRRPHPDVRRVPLLPDVYAQLTVERFEYERPSIPANFRFVGPLRPVGGEDIPGWWDPVREPSIVAVKYGEGAELSDLVLPTIEAFGDDDVTVLIAGVEREVVARAFGRTLPCNVHFEQAMPWSRMLLRRSVLVTAGDYLPVQYALRSGTPVVAAGKRSSQLETAARVEWSGAGINLRTHTPDVATLRAAVLRAFGDPDIQLSAAKIAAQIASTDAEGTLAEIVESVPTTREMRQRLAETA